MKYTLLSILLLTMGSCKDRTQHQTLGVSALKEYKDQVWQANNRWSVKYEKLYQSWLKKNLATVSPGRTLMYQKYALPIEKIVRKLKNKPDFHFDCADNVIFFRAQFAKIHQLPFMVRISPHRNHRFWWLVGHFGFRVSSNYDKDEYSEAREGRIASIKTTYTNFNDPDIRFAILMWDISQNFGVTSFASSVGLNGDVYDILPSKLREGDIFVEAYYGKRGHSTTIADIDFSKPPFLKGYSYAYSSAFL